MNDRDVTFCGRWGRIVNAPGIECVICTVGNELPWLVCAKKQNEGGKHIPVLVLYNWLFV